MKYREYYRMTRPSLNVPFHPPESIFFQTEELSLWPTDVFTQDPSIPVSKAHAHYLEFYHNDCEPTEGSGYLSEDGLTVTYTLIYKSEEIMNKRINDSWYNDNRQIRQAYNALHNIITSNEFIAIKE
jgi:hypothetical protein